MLTEKGWKKYYEVKDGERIAEYDGANHVIRFALPLGKYVYQYCAAHFMRMLAVEKAIAL